jgi:hypothetical protein
MTRMPSADYAINIRNSLVEGESYEDFAYLFDALMSLRGPFNHDLSLSERVVGRLVCVLFPAKPPQYVRAMQRFRLGFAGVSTNPEFQAEFSNSVRHAAITLNQPEGIIWRPSLYFALPPRLRELELIGGWF